MSRDSENHETIVVMSSGYAADVRRFPEEARHSSNMGAEKQSRRMSLVEAVTNVVVGFGVALLTQIIIFPLFGLEVTLGENLAIGGLFTVASIARSYALRRVFEAIRARPSMKTGAATRQYLGRRLC